MGRWVAVLLVLLIVGAAAVQAAERPPASLVPAEVMFYGELNLTQLSAIGEGAKPLDQALEQSGLLPAVRVLAGNAPGAAEAINKLVATISQGLQVVGPRLSWSVLPEIGMASPAIGMAPAFLLVADVRDPAAFTEFVDRALVDYRVEYSEEGRSDGIRVISLQNGPVVAIGSDWAALCTSPGEVDVISALVASEGKGSLAEEPRYLSAIKGLPQDALITEYASPTLFTLLSAQLGSVTAGSGVELPALPENGLAWALRMSVNSQEGRRLLSLTWTTDADAVSSVVNTALVAVAAPVFARARESARKVQCLSNVKNISMAMQMYLTDYDKFPKADRWTTDLDEYMKNRDVLRCPSDPSGAASSYGMNWGFSGKPVKMVKDASRQVVIYETAHPGPCPRGGKTDVVSPPRHMGGNNFGFVDGHARWIAETQFGAVDW